METLFGLPAHPLMVHAPVVFMPLALLLALVYLLRPSSRGGSGLLLLATALVTFVTSMAAKLSGEAFDEALNEQFTIDRSHHQDLGDQTVLFVFIFLVVSLLAVGMGRVQARRGNAGGNAGAAAGTVASVLVVLAGVLATVWMIRTGHAGATLVHDGKI